MVLVDKLLLNSSALNCQLPEFFAYSVLPALCFSVAILVKIALPIFSYFNTFGKKIEGSVIVGMLLTVSKCC